MGLNSIFKGIWKPIPLAAPVTNIEAVNPAIKREYIYKTGAVAPAGGTTNLYIVPAGKEFYLYNSMMYMSGGVGAFDGWLAIYTDINVNQIAGYIIRGTCGITPISPTFISNCYEPFKVTEGQVIALAMGGAGNGGLAEIYGILIDKGLLN